MHRLSSSRIFVALALLAVRDAVGAPQNVRFEDRKASAEGRANTARQYDRNQIINDIFQIPIQTLTAVQSLVSNTRPVFPLLFTNPQGGTNPIGGIGGIGGGGIGSNSPGGGGSGGFFGSASSPSNALSRPQRPAPPSGPGAGPGGGGSAGITQGSIYDPFRPRPSHGPVSFGANAVQVPIHVLSAVGQLLQDLSAPVRQRFTRSAPFLRLQY